MFKSLLVMVSVSASSVFANASTPVFEYGSFELPSQLREQIEKTVTENCVPSEGWTVIDYNSHEFVSGTSTATTEHNLVLQIQTGFEMEAPAKILVKALVEQVPNMPIQNSLTVEGDVCN